MIGIEKSYGIVPIELQRAPAQAVVPAQRLDARARRLDQRVDDGARDVVAVQRRVQRGPVAARSRVEPVALAHAVVQRRVGVERLRVRAVVRQERRAAIRLVPVGGQHGAVLAVRHRHLLAGAERDLRKLGVGRRQRLVRLVRRARQPARQRHQPLALLVEHVLLLAEHLLDRKPVQGEVRAAVHPLADRRQRDREEFRAEPRGRLLPARHERLHLLATTVDLVVALVFVVLQGRVEIDLVGELPEVVVQAVGREQLVRPLPERALERGVFADPALQLAQGGFPVRPGRVDVIQTPLVGVVNLGAVPGPGFGFGKHGTMISPIILTRSPALEGSC